MIRGVKKRQIEELIGKLANLQEEVDAIKSQMDEYFDERSESWQMGEGGDRYQDKMMDIECILGNLEDAQDVLNGWFDE